MNSETKNCQNCKTDFMIESDDFGFYEKMGVPAPTFCPQCRMQRRLAHRNDRSLYRRECSLCKRNVLSIYHKDSEIKNVYCPECWWGDGWNPMDYGVEYNPSENFFTQYNNFKQQVPHESVYQTNFVDSEYCNFGHGFKNCYLVFGGYGNENVSYGNLIGNIKDSANIALSLDLEQCYDCINCFRSSKLRFCYSCEDSSNLTLCIDCYGCIDCFGCVGLRNKQHYIFNQKYSKQEFDDLMKEFAIHKYSNFVKLKEKFNEFRLTKIFRSNRNRRTTDCTGDDLQNSKNSHMSFWGNNLENVKNCFFVVNSRDSQDLTALGSVSGVSELLYEVASSFGGSFQIAGIRTLFDRNSFYSEDCHNCNDIFGCIGLKKKSYCIFNKQYTKEEYERLVYQIRKDMEENKYIDKKGRSYTYGDFWPIEFSPFGYNESKVTEYFPLTRDEIIEKGYKYYEKNNTNYTPTILNKDIPDDRTLVNRSIKDQIIECEHKNCNHSCTGAFKIIENELLVLENLNLPLPRICPNCRHRELLKKQNPINLWHRSCVCEKDNHAHAGKCDVEFETAYSPNRPEIIYCEKCYQQEVV